MENILCILDAKFNPICKLGFSTHDLALKELVKQMNYLERNLPMGEQRIIVWYEGETIVCSRLVERDWEMYGKE